MLRSSRIRVLSKEFWGVLKVRLLACDLRRGVETSRTVEPSFLKRWDWLESRAEQCRRINVVLYYCATMT
jgi:hypothetical protein